MSMFAYAWILLGAMVMGTCGACAWAIVDINRNEPREDEA